MNQLLLQAKTDRRKTALALLQTQLEKGTKPVKGIKPYDGVKRDKDGKRIKLDVVKLTPAEIATKQAQIDGLIAKIAAAEENIAIQTVMNKGKINL